jgi:hypothetical protein
MPIPALESSGILPPYVGKATHSANMSPYATTLVEIARQFCHTDPRREILRGLLSYRRRLNALGFSRGIQWLSGSFLEDIEVLEKRPPNDVDVVTFFHRPSGIADLPSWQALIDANRIVFEHGQVKAHFKVDAQFISLDNSPAQIVDQTRFWFGLFSHRRNGLWKGLLQIPLAVGSDDADAVQLVTMP